MMNNPNDAALCQIHAIVTGRVQGVGFRATVRRHAQQLGLTGTVCNLPAGTVEIYAQGTRAQLEKFLMQLRTQPGGSYVTQLDVAWQKPAELFPHFSIN